MRLDPLQHVDEIDIGVDLVQRARRDQALDLTDALSTEFSPTEEPALPTHRDRPQRPLQVIRVDRESGIREEDLEACSPFERVACSDGKRVRGQQRPCGEFFLQPREELRDNLSTSVATDFEFGGVNATSLFDLGFDLIELADVFQRARSKRRFRVFGFDKTAPGVRPTQRMLDFFSSFRIGGVRAVAVGGKRPLEVTEERFEFR